VAEVIVVVTLTPTLGADDIFISSMLVPIAFESLLLIAAVLVAASWACCAISGSVALMITVTGTASKRRRLPLRNARRLWGGAT